MNTIKREKRNLSAGGKKHNASHPLLQVNHKKGVSLGEFFSQRQVRVPRQETLDLCVVHRCSRVLKDPSEWFVTDLIVGGCVRGTCVCILFQWLPRDLLALLTDLEVLQVCKLDFICTCLMFMLNFTYCERGVNLLKLQHMAIQFRNDSVTVYLTPCFLICQGGYCFFFALQ